jgi:Tfp pilus assembly protein PilE
MSKARSSLPRRGASGTRPAELVSVEAGLCTTGFSGVVLRPENHRGKLGGGTGVRADKRAGFTLFELTITAILLAAVMVTAIPTLAWIVRARQAAERQQAAVLGVGNLMERVTALAWDDITPEALAAIALPEDLSRQLSDADLKISVVSTPETPEAKRVLIELRWQESSAGTQAAPVRLAAWVYRHRKELS